jgi:hypothetical protein
MPRQTLEDEMKHWHDRAMDATKGTRMGAIVARAIDRDISAPRFRSKAIVTSDGYVMADFERANGQRHGSAFVCSINDLCLNAVGLARHIKMTKAEREEFAVALIGWLKLDYSKIAHRQVRFALGIDVAERRS